MRDETRNWLRGLDALGSAARRKVFEEGQDPKTVVKELADRSVDPRRHIDWLGLCADLKIELRKPNIFAAQCELFDFSKAVISGMVTAP